MHSGTLLPRRATAATAEWLAGNQPSGI